MDLTVTRTQEECVALIDETVEYYQKNPRGITGSWSCVYYDPVTGNMCAVGRCMAKPSKFQNKFCSVESLIKTVDKDFFKKEYKGYPIDLWVELQNLHDSGGYWDDDNDRELNTRGKVFYEFLKSEKWV